MSFRMPRTWRRAPATAGGGAEIFSFTSQQPGNASVDSAPPIREFALVVGRKTDPNLTLEQMAVKVREAVVAAVGHPVEFTRDAGETIADVPAWRLEYPSTRRFGIVTDTGGRRSEREVTVDVIERQVFWIRGDVVCTAQFTSEPQGALMMDRIAEQIFGSVKYAD